MNFINIILFMIIIYILYIFTTRNNTKTTPKKINNISTKIPYKISRGRSYKDDIVNDVISIDTSYNEPIIIKETMNPNFIKIKFHNDYRDVITAINNIIPTEKQLFNLANIPLKYSEPDPSEITYMVYDFLKVLNENIKNVVPPVRTCNTGWDEAIVDPNIKSGWDRQQEVLGLQVSLFEKPALRAPVKLIAVNSVEKRETEDEIKYTSTIIIQKLNVDDQMILRVAFIQDKRPLNNEDLFFKQSKIQLFVSIESIFIEGYLSKHGDDAKMMFDDEQVKYYNIDNMEHNDLTDPKYIRSVLMDVYKRRTQEMEQRNALLDEEGQEFHKSLPHPYLFDNILGTRTIFPKHPY